MVRRLCLAFAVSLLCGLNGGWGEERRMENFEEKILQDMPQDIVDVVRRADRCQYWKILLDMRRPRDDEQDKIAKTVMQQLRCQDLPTDLAWLSEQYASDGAVMTTLKHLREHYLR